MLKPKFYKILFPFILMVNGIAIACGNTSEGAAGGVVVTTFMDKITFRVDMRLQTVNGGVYIAGDFFDQIGLPNWTEIAMCDLGSGIWEISVTGIAPGLYQYKFLNGIGGWEFNGWGGPCTNAADNNNRWLNYGGGVHVEGPWCWGTCDLFCPPYGDPGVSDTDPPTIDEPAPANTTIECGNPLPTGETLNASDGCNINVTTETDMPTDDNSGLNGCGLGEIIRTWVAEDCAGNTASVSQTITIEDTTDPTIDAPVPANVTVECGNIPLAQSLDASDNCDTGVTSTGLPSDDNSGLNACGEGEIIRTWEVSDCAGNTNNVSQTITVEDTTNPTIDESIPANITVECGNVPAAQSLDASDSCDSGITSTGMPSDDNSGLDACGVGEIIRTWEVTDCSGNAVSASQTITVEDDTAPALAAPAPANITVTCGNIPAAAALAVTDDCDNGVTTTGFPTDDNSGIGPCGTGQIIRSWAVSDCTGNSLSVSQTITVEDNTPPTIDGPVPANTTIECGDPLPVGMPLSASDDCDINVTSTGPPDDDLSNIGLCGTGDVIRSWEVADCSGNTTTITQTITIEDTTDPFIIGPIPANTTVDCNGIPPAAPLAATDGCDVGLQVTGFPNDDLSGLDNCGLGTVVRTWTVTDCNGNMAIGTQLITIDDNQPPFLTQAVPADITLSCGSIPIGAPLSAADDCDGTLVSTGMPVDDNSALNNCGVGVIVRTWTAMDCAGNSLFETQAITVTDDEPPVLEIPADTSLDCSNIPDASAADASAADNCSTTSITYDGETIMGIGCPYEIHRTWSAEDECGNMSTATQIITITDTEAPTLAAPPADVTVCAGAIPAVQDLEWTDNCDGMGSVFATDESNGMNDPETITRTWEYTDNCGNSVSASQTITVISAPTANAGTDQNLCADSTALLSVNISGGYNSLEWTTSGTGVFEDETSDSTNYIPSAEDITNDSVIIYLTAQTNGVGACGETSDSLILYFINPPSANAGNDMTITCESSEVILDGSGSSSGIGYLYEWNGPGINAGNMIEQNPEVSLPGNYTITVIDTINGQSCMSIDSVEVFENTVEPTANAGEDMTLTCSQTSVTLNGSGSTSGMGVIYQWTGPGIIAANENLINPTVSESGTYTLIVTDTINGCTAADEAEIMLDGNLPTADGGPNQTIDCNYDAVTLDGSNSSSGPGIDYQWFDPNGLPLGNDLIQIVTDGGIYSLQVSDTNNGCEITATVEVVVDTDPPIVDAGIDATLTCDEPTTELGGNSSTAPVFEYEWILNSIVVGTEPTFTASQAGIYTLNILNTQNGCSASDGVEVFLNADLPVADAGADQQLDCGSTTVTLDGSSSSSGMDILYEWVGPNFSSTDISVQVSTPGIYYLTVLNASSACEAVDSVIVTNDSNLPISDAGADTTLNCYAPQILLDGSGSTQGMDVVYEWQDGMGVIVGNDLTLSVDEPGVYTLYVNNIGNGCSSSDQVIVGLDNQPPLAEAGLDQQFTCTMTTANLDGSGSSTGPGFSYLWEGPGINGANDQITAEAIEVGTYTFTVTNLINGCTAFDEVEVTQNPDVPSAFAEANQDFDCFTSMVELSGTASVSQAAYEWSGPGINSSNFDLQNPQVSEPGVYSLIVTDQVTGCESIPVFVEVLDLRILPSINLTVNADLDCQTTSVLIDGSGSEQGDTIAYQWLYGGNVVSTGPDDFWLADEAGFYTLVVFNTSTGCLSEDSIEVLDVSELPPAEISGSSVVNCLNETVTLSENSATLNVNYSWSTIGGHILQTNQNEIEINAAGQYIVEVFNPVNGCLNTDTLVVSSDFEQPIILFETDFSIGCSQSTVTLSANVMANSNDLAFAWSGAGFSSSEEMPIVSQAGDYELVVTNNINGCSTVASTSVSQANGIENVFFTVIPPACFGEMDGILQIDSVTGANPPVNFLFNNSTVNDPYIDGLGSGTYSFTVIDSDGCEMDAAFTIEEPPLLIVDLGPDVEINLGETLQLSAITSSPVSQYIWSNANSLSCDDCPEPIAQPAGTTLYTLTVSTSDGCVAEDDILISINGNVDIYHPSAFSPNNDGINDVFTFFGGQQLQDIHTFLVFDRWGAKVFDAQHIPPNDPNNGWNGTHKGQLLDAGIYVFYAEIVLSTGEMLEMKGEVALIR